MPFRVLVLVFLCIGICSTLHAPKCLSDLDCSLNGLCMSDTGVCVCDAAWTGATCGRLNELPTRADDGINFNAHNVTTWGASFVFDDAEKLWHVFYSRMVQDCALGAWQTNSACFHAVTADPLRVAFGTADDVAVPAFCHNPSIVRTVDRARNNATIYLLFHIGAGAESRNTPRNCTQTTHHDGAGRLAGPPAGGGGAAAWWDVGLITFHWAESLRGPWKAHSRAVLQGRLLHWDLIVSNPSAWVHSDGSVLLAYRGRSVRDSSERIGLARAADFRGPYERLSSAAPISPVYGEDPYLFADQRGNFHILYHDFAVGGGHLYAQASDLARWYGGGSSGSSASTAFSDNVTWVDGSITRMVRRERPTLVLAPTAQRAPIALYSGVVPPSASHADVAHSLAVPLPPPRPVDAPVM